MKFFFTVKSSRTSQLSSAANSARSDDSGSLKKCVEYILPNPQVHCIEPPIGGGQTKTIRGFNHFQTARLLCPKRRLSSFEKDAYVLSSLLSYC